MVEQRFHTALVVGSNPAVRTNMKYSIDQIPVISQNIYTTVLDSVNNLQIISDLDNYGVGTNQESPEHGWISRGFVQYEDIVVPVTPEITKLENKILGAMEELTGNTYLIDDMWAVNLIKNQSVIAHSHHSNLHAHPAEYYSIAYYPDAPLGSAELIFLAEWCGVMQKTCAVTPKTGMLVIFNSYMTHMTARHKLDDRRLVLSMNLSPSSPNKTPNADWSTYWNRPVIERPLIVE